ncbi:hypothetical protein RchiOBHm_Chr7g0219791 [Rosa chinensis]|uniref:Uncharacterized protein n=1 Tax=Rosa chinensis TaxID=74649 RepID=A0A2P6PCM1_ROSCH|nr:hypothetical protein RchiOBHm_Chr7g0219791 [Rosa chinensis]
MFHVLYGLSFSVSIIGFCPRFTPNSGFVFFIAFIKENNTDHLGLKDFTNPLFLSLGFDGKQIGLCKIEGKSSNQVKWQKELQFCIVLCLGFITFIVIVLVLNLVRCNCFNYA